MSRTQDRILIIGDTDRQVHDALLEASPRSQIVQAPTIFDGIAELHTGEFQTVLAPTEPIERRPESAVQTLRSAAGDARLLLFGHPTLEPLSRKMLEFGCDDYLITPITAGDLSQILNQPRENKEEAAPHRAGISQGDGIESDHQPISHNSNGSSPATFDSTIFLDALLSHPTDAPAAALARLNQSLAPARLSLLCDHDAPPPAANGYVAFSRQLQQDNAKSPTLYLQVPRTRDELQSRSLLEKLAAGFAKLHALRDRQAQLQKLATTDELTGLANMRWFRHFLSQVMESARKRKTPVTLLLFDIDDFKKYNDRFGHGVGDEILIQTAQLMRRCVREHDLVARIGGDEFAVVFWEKEGPRTVRDPHAKPVPSTGRPPQTPQIMCRRFQSLLSKHTFSALGPAGRGTLTISGGLATAFWDGQTPDELIGAADRALMFGAKKSGKNSIALVGDHPSVQC